MLKEGEVKLEKSAIALKYAMDAERIWTSFLSSKACT